MVDEYCEPDSPPKISLTPYPKASASVRRASRLIRMVLDIRLVDVVEVLEPVRQAAVDPRV
jgi:hypothetical protein